MYIPIYIYPIFGTHQVICCERDGKPVKNAVRERTRCHKRTLSSVPIALNIKPDVQVHALTTFALTSFSRHSCAEALKEAIYIKLYGTLSFYKLVKSTCNNLL